MKVIRIKKKALSEDAEQRVDQEFRDMDGQIQNIAAQIQNLQLNPQQLIQFMSSLQARLRQMDQFIEREEMEEEQELAFMQQQMQSGDGVGNQVGSPYSTPTNPAGPQYGVQP